MMPPVVAWRYSSDGAERPSCMARIRPSDLAGDSFYRCRRCNEECSHPAYALVSEELRRSHSDVPLKKAIQLRSGEQYCFRERLHRPGVLGVLHQHCYRPTH